MALKVKSLTPEQGKSLLKSSLKLAKSYRKDVTEGQWLENENMLYNAIGYRERTGSVSFNSLVELGNDEVDQDEHDVGVNYVFRHLRFLHAQMSANPPSVVASPSTSDPEDRRAADGADRVCRFARKEYNLHEKFDQLSLKTLSKGTGWIKVIYDPNKGEVASFNKDTGELLMKGEIDISSPSTWAIWIDPDAPNWDSVRYVFEEHVMPMDEALLRWPEMQEILEKSKLDSHSVPKSSLFGFLNKERAEERELVVVYEYYEKALPINGMAGRRAWCTSEGDLLEPMTDNPHWNKDLPYRPLTDIDVEDQVFGKSFIEYEAPIQDIINRMDGSLLDNVRAHSAIRLAIPDTAELTDTSMSDSPIDLVKFTGTIPPHYMPPPGSMPDAIRLRTILEQGGDAIAGINESMYGQIKRETSGFSMQTAINAGNTVRFRLFNKYTSVVEWVYRQILGLAAMHWKTKRFITVLGKEKAFETVAIKGSDLKHGYDLVVEYGASLSLDPTARRQEITTLMPVFEKAGVPMKTILSMLKLNELGGLYDRMQLAEDRQQEIFEVMIAAYEQGTPAYLAPEDLQDHQGMLAYSYNYVMTSEFRDLPDELQLLIKRHIKEREQMAAQQAAPASAPAPAGLPMALPQPPAGGPAVG